MRTLILYVSTATKPLIEGAPVKLTVKVTRPVVVPTIAMLGGSIAIFPVVAACACGAPGKRWPMYGLVDITSVRMSNETDASLSCLALTVVSGSPPFDLNDQSQHRPGVLKVYPGTKKYNQLFLSDFSVRMIFLKRFGPS